MSKTKLPAWKPPKRKRVRIPTLPEGFEFGPILEHGCNDARDICLASVADKVVSASVTVRRTVAPYDTVARAKLPAAYGTINIIGLLEQAVAEFTRKLDRAAISVLT